MGGPELSHRATVRSGFGSVARERSARTNLGAESAVLDTPRTVQVPSSLSRMTGKSPMR